MISTSAKLVKVGIGLTLLSTGCATIPDRTPTSGPPLGHLLFNPQPEKHGFTDIPRDEWPSSVAQLDGTEHIYYAETLFDWQGPTGGHTDRYYRRFQSIRSGSARR